MAKDSQGVTGLSGKLVTQPSLPSSAVSGKDQMGKVVQAKGNGKVTDRASMCLVDQAKLPGKK